MRGRRFRYNNAAEAELDAAAKWYDEREPDLTLGLDLIEEVEARIETILEAPDRWPLRGGVRRALLDRFPFAVVYRELSDEEIEIVAIAHLKRRPGHWHSR